MRNKFVQRIQSIVPVTISKTKMDEYFTRAIIDNSPQIILVVNIDGEIFEGNEEKFIHPYIVKMDMQPTDKLFSFIVKDILKEEDERIISNLSILYGCFHINGCQMEKTKNSRIYDYYYNQ